MMTTSAEETLAENDTLRDAMQANKSSLCRD